MLSPHYEVFEPIPGKKKIRVLFDIANRNVLENFMLFEVEEFEEKIKSVFDQALVENMPHIEFSGNIFHIVVGPANTKIYDMIADDDVCCVVDTRELYMAILEWGEKRRAFYGSSQ